ncbi:MAG: hypothetical protein HY921_02635 [Elusimicrobia bacterium]|nr:hypothetical protein [Elusimicrobiota bacterium]
MDEEPSLRRPLIRYYACRAFSSGLPAICDRLAFLDEEKNARKGGPGVFPAAYSCRRDFYLWVFDRARLQASPGIIEACLKENSYRRPGDEGPFKKESFDKACRIIARYSQKRADLEGACAALLPHFRSRTSLGECRALFRYGYGEDEAACMGLRSPYRVERCLELVRYRKAYQSRDVGACGASLYCRLLMGDGPGACQSLNDEITGLFCSRSAARRSLE